MTWLCGSPTKTSPSFGALNLSPQGPRAQAHERRDLSGIESRRFINGPWIRIQRVLKNKRHSTRATSWKRTKDSSFGSHNSQQGIRPAALQNIVCISTYSTDPRVYISILIVPLDLALARALLLFKVKVLVWDMHLIAGTNPACETS